MNKHVGFFSRKNKKYFSRINKLGGVFGATSYGIHQNKYNEIFYKKFDSDEYVEVTNVTEYKHPSIEECIEEVKRDYKWNDVVCVGFIDFDCFKLGKEIV